MRNRTRSQKGNQNKKGRHSIGSANMCGWRITIPAKSRRAVRMTIGPHLFDGEIIERSEGEQLRKGKNNCQTRLGRDSENEITFFQLSNRHPHDPHIMKEEMAVLTARCHCGQNNIPLEMKRSELPLKAFICHCTMCRRVSGAMCCVYAELPVTIALVEGLRSYMLPTGSLRYFCKNCSTQMFVRRVGGTWLAMTGALETSVKDLEGLEIMTVGDAVDVQYQQHVEDTVDGGIAVWMRSPKPRIDAMDMWKRAISSLSVESGGELRGTCLCGEVRILVKVPEGKRLQNSHCTCHSCRVTLGGSEIMQYFFSDVSNTFVEAANGEALQWPMSESEWKERYPQVSIYNSSPTVIRGSCGTCGAKAFFYTSESPDVAEPAYGLFTSDGCKGIIRDDLLKWTAKEEAIDFAEEAKGREKILVDEFTAGFNKWRRMKGE